jgi:hypothetical protein
LKLKGAHTIRTVKGIDILKDYWEFDTTNFGSVLAAFDDPGAGSFPYHIAVSTSRTVDHIDQLARFVVESHS